MGEDLETEGFAPLRIKRVVRETADAVSLVLDVPDHCSSRFRYEAGQFLTLRVTVDGQELRRCYSMSSAPVEDELQITVKRDPGGLVSNWINDTASEGAELHAAPPDGRFLLRDNDSGIIAFAGGSGITPIMSLIRTALVSSSRPVRLFYANRSRDGVMLESGAPAERVHLERFTVAVDEAEASAAAGASEATEEVVIELDNRTTRAEYRAGNTLLQTARIAGLRAPASCETGSCGTCMARILDGSARMLNNDALDDDEVAEGWVLTCQSLPTSRTVHLSYE
jgi:3-ketosteroid 9alpha-monooxygenase subunit B